MDRYKVKKRLADGCTIALYVVMILFFFGPILWITSIAFRTPADLFSSPSLFPRSPTLENFVYVLTRTGLPVYIWNSFRLVFFTVVGTLAAAIPAAYAFSRLKFRFKTTSVIVILLFQMISPVVIGIPLFRYFAELDLLNNYFGLTMVYIAVQLPFATYLLTGVVNGVPKELDESAHIDGASRFVVLSRVIVPTSISGIASATIFIAINSWSQFIVPFFLLNRDRFYPVSVGVLMAQGSFQDISIQYVAAASVVGLLPAVVLVVFLQKFILTALLSGAVKG